MAESIFFRGKSAYLVGSAFRAGDGHSLSLALALLHGETGITLDALLTGEDYIAILFSFTRSYFRVDTARPYELVRFLRTLMPRKRLADLYMAIGYNKHGKTEFYRDFLRHLRASEDRFEHAEGALIRSGLKPWAKSSRPLRSKERFPKPSLTQRHSDLIANQPGCG
jgi:isocitrate dehydrogenase kinase/phosphatase